jgi:hypothetical protein
LSDHSWTLESGYRLDVFAEQDSVTTADVVDLWVREGVLPAQEAERRAGEILLVATASDGTLGGVSTAYLDFNQQLGAQMWYGREFVASAHRKAGIMMGLAYAGRDYLQTRFASGADRRSIGMLFEVENEVLKRGGPGPIARFGPKAIWPTDYVFIGENERGDHIRVHYFPGAHAPEPASSDDNGAIPPGVALDG